MVEGAADLLRIRAILAFANRAMSRAGKRIMPLKPAALPELAGLELQAEVFAAWARLIGKPRKGVHRERIPVKVIFQVEDAGKTRAGEFRLAPGAVRLLAVNKIGNGFRDRRIVRCRTREQTDQSPSRLRSGARTLSFGGRRVIAHQRFAEAAVGFLHSPQPDGRTLAVIARGERDRF